MNDNQRNNKKGYESEDGIGVVYDLSSRSNCTSTIYTLLLVTSLLVFSGLICFGAGFWFGEDQILKQYLFNFDQTGQKPEIPMNIPEQYQYQKRYIKPSKGGIFPPPMNVFGAGNGENPVGLTEEEKKRLEEAEALCDAKKCCREEDDVEETDSSQCPDMGYLECLAADNACVWDCTQGHQGENNLHYDREFKGIDRHDAEGDGEEPAKEEDYEPNKDTVDPDLLVDTVDECGTIYEFHLKEQDRLEEAERLENNPNTHQEGNGGDVDDDGNRRRLFNFTGITPSGEMNETLRRRLEVLGVDSRTDVTYWQWPYYKVVKVTYQGQCDEDDEIDTCECSGALITTRHVLTAAHCISDGRGGFYSGWKVKPNYRAGRSAEFTVYQGWLFTRWHDYHDFNYDIGILTLHASSTGFGWFGFGYNTGITSAWNFGVAGYPGDKYYMQRQNMYMDYQITTNLLMSKTGDNVVGNSGGPAYWESNKAIYGVTSFQNGFNFNGWARITKEKFDAMCSYISTFSETSYYRNYIS